MVYIIEVADRTFNISIHFNTKELVHSVARETRMQDLKWTKK